MGAPPGSARCTPVRYCIKRGVQGGAAPPGRRGAGPCGLSAQRTAAGWGGADDVQVFAGAMGAGGRMLAKGIVGQNRSDVGTAFNYPFWSASGWSATVPAGGLGAGNQTLNVYIHTPGKGWWFKQV